VAAPLTSIDTTIQSGDEIVIEERSPKELTHSHGGQGTQIAATGIDVWNPAFDVTPAHLITAIITDQGVITKEHNVDAFDVVSHIGNSIKKSPLIHSTANGRDTDDATIATAGGFAEQVKALHSSFYQLDEALLVDYVKARPNLAQRLGGTHTEWKIKEVGDGNLNLVFIVLGPKGSFVLKQALPYVRCVGESWPMTIERAYFETTVLREHGRLAPSHVPEVYNFDHPMAVTVMRYLEPPHIILRKGLIRGTVYPLLAQHMSDYMASTLFHTSLLANSTLKHREAGQSGVP
jgi:hypothetical protein